MPETQFIDTKGVVRLHKRGPLNFEDMKREIESIIN